VISGFAYVLASTRIWFTITRGLSFRLSASHLVSSRAEPGMLLIADGNVISDSLVQPLKKSVFKLESLSGNLTLSRLVQFSKTQ
jgi:hypothetical protein